MTYAEYEAFRQGRNTEADFGTRAQVEYWPDVRLSQTISPTGPTGYGRKNVVTIFAPEGQPPEVEDEDLVDEVFLSAEELAALPGWTAFKADLFELLETKAAAQKQARLDASQVPPPATVP